MGIRYSIQGTLSRLSPTVLQALLYPIVLHAFVTRSSPMSTRWKRTRPLALAKIKRTVVSCFRVLHHHAACLYVSITPNNVGIRSEIFDFCLPSVAATSAFFIFMRYENLPAVGTKRVIPRLKISDEKFSGGRKKRKKKRGLTWIQ